MYVQLHDPGVPNGGELSECALDTDTLEQGQTINIDSSSPVLGTADYSTIHAYRRLVMVGCPLLVADWSTSVPTKLEWLQTLEVGAR